MCMSKVQLAAELAALQTSIFLSAKVIFSPSLAHQTLTMLHLPMSQRSLTHAASTHTASVLLDSCYVLTHRQ